MSSVNFLDKLLDGVKVEWVPLEQLIHSLKTGLNPRQNFQLNTEDADGYYVTVREIQGGKITFLDKTDRVNSNALKLINGRSTLEVGDILFSGTGTVGRTAVIEEDPLNWNIKEGVYSIKPIKERVLSKFLCYTLNSSEIIKEYSKKIVGSPVISLPMGELKKLLLPIPCPDNPKKSLEIQAEIVRILDSFTALTSELCTELFMRKKQLRHYYFDLLKFPCKTKYLKIGECCDIKKGITAIKKATPGKYPLVATTEERQSSSEYQFDCSAVCVPLISSRGHGVASIDRIYYQDCKFALGNILCAIIPNDTNFLSAKFLRHYLFDKKDVLLVPLMRGGANVSVTVDSIKGIEIPIPPLAEQQRIVRILDKFDELVKSLPREIELRQKQYAYYRDLLLSFPQAQTA